MIFAMAVGVPLTLYFLAITVVYAVPCLIWGYRRLRMPRFMLGTVMAVAGLYIAL
ncbi:hypothetical protein [Roseomonas xinghualingensis]|uniref:hypothetical protein n=1 Tax=Roseomonas xinghualingensis TaxID=2986475 RepID=UPI0021F21EBA|nr:hypothetical protein [Roseomonas sp. SXEYE001]MCV4209634.1 hypothetical protein [Roseomonas sp. SXEYE001]